MQAFVRSLVAFAFSLLRMMFAAVLASFAASGEGMLLYAVGGGLLAMFVVSSWFKRVPAHAFGDLFLHRFSGWMVLASPVIGGALGGRLLLSGGLLLVLLAAGSLLVFVSTPLPRLLVEAAYGAVIVYMMTTALGVAPALVFAGLALIVAAVMEREEINAFVANAFVELNRPPQRHLQIVS